MADGVENTNTKVTATSRSKEPKPSVLVSHGYSMGRSVGSGSYATVKIAYSERHRCHVAIKIVSKQQEAKDYLGKFLPREINVVKGLRHENLIKYYQAIETTLRVYIIMEYAENGCLLDIIKKENKIDEDRARKWFMQLASAIEYCHAEGVVHRDIKCENLLLDTSYNIKLSDFGFARDKMLMKGGEMKLSKTFCGSYAYASPEILLGVPYRPNASDVWSIGVVLYAMIFGMLPFDDNTFQKLLKQVQKPVVFPLDEKISSNCKELILKLLSPLQNRIHVTEIKHQPWCQIDPAVREPEEKEEPQKEKADAALKNEPKKENT